MERAPRKCFRAACKGDTDGFPEQLQMSEVHLTWRWHLLEATPGEPEYLLNADAPLTMRFDPPTIWNILWEGFRVHMLLQNNAGHFDQFMSGH